MDIELLGLTEYEGKVYRAMLAEHPATAYKLGKLSGVPLSRVYEVVSRLAQKGIAQVLPGEPARYAPTPPETLVAGARIRTERRLDELASELAALYRGDENAGALWLRGEENVLARAQALLAGATSEVLIAAVPAAQTRLESLLGANASVQQVRTLAMQAATPDDAGFTLVVDGDRALIGRLGPRADALSSSHPAIVRLCADYFRLRSIADAAQEMVAANRAARGAGRFDKPSGWLGWEEEKQRRLLHVN